MRGSVSISRQTSTEWDEDRICIQVFDDGTDPRPISRAYIGLRQFAECITGRHRTPADVEVRVLEGTSQNE